MSDQIQSASTDVVAVGTTGGTVPNTGPYKSSGPINITMFLAKGDKFPPSPFPQSAEAKGEPTASASWAMVSSAEVAAVSEQ